jgi:hypothetical protein
VRYTDTHAFARISSSDRVVYTELAADLRIEKAILYGCYHYVCDDNKYFGKIVGYRPFVHGETPTPLPRGFRYSPRYVTWPPKYLSLIMPPHACPAHARQPYPNREQLLAIPVLIASTINAERPDNSPTPIVPRRIERQDRRGGVLLLLASSGKRKFTPEETQRIWEVLRVLL